MRTTGRPTREFVSASSPEALKEGLPIRIGSGANPKIILRNETFVELGNPAAGSCAVVLWTDTSGLISDGRITLIGPDVQEARGASLPFGQILLVAGKDLSAEEHQSVGQIQY